ncbi:MAG TPA: ROK family protein [Acidimicrobiales bacterium]
MELLGIDIGGTGIKGAPVDLVRGVLAGERFRLETPKGAEPDAVAEVVARVASHHGTTGPVGITFPGVVQHGTILTAANMGKAWVGMDADTFFTESIGRPVHLTNDADAAGVAEMRYGVGRDRKGVVLMLTLGTGIGSALFVDGRLVPNTEFGHIEIDGRDAETLASGRAQEKDKLSWREYTKRLNRYLAAVDALVWPDLVILGGGVSKDSAKFLPSLRVRCPVVVAQLLNNAGIVGAAAIVAELGA